MIDPELRKPVTELDMVRGVVVDGGDVTVTIALTVVGCPLRNSFQEQVAREVGAVAGVDIGAARVRRDEPGRARRADDEASRRPLRRGAHDPARAATRVIAVASGKGGVGKSSLTVNLAAALASLGREVGILDADVYGHSIPHMLGIRQKPVLVDRLMIPPVKHDLKLMSIGFFLDDNQPVMWRGPMLHKALEQFLAGRALGRARRARRRHAAGNRRRLDLARPAAAARRGRRRDDAAAARAGGGRAARPRWRRRPACSCSA